VITREEFLGAVADDLVASYDENGQVSVLTIPLDRVLTCGIWGKPDEELDDAIQARIDLIAQAIDEEANGFEI
jgi:hypothetical protein